MIRILVFIRKRPDLTMEQFIDYYETRHAPLASRIFPMYAHYRRNYVTDELFGQPRDLGYDVVTELEFATRADYDRFLEIASDPAVQAEIHADEANFLLSADVRLFMADVRGF